MSQWAQGQHNNWPRRACDHGGGYNYNNWGEGENWGCEDENHHHKKKSPVDVWPQSIHIQNPINFILSSQGGNANFTWSYPSCPNPNVTPVGVAEKQTSVYLEGAENEKALSSPTTLHPSVTQPLLDYQTSRMRRSAVVLDGGMRNTAILTTLSTAKIPRRASGFGYNTPSAPVAVEKDKVYLHILTTLYTSDSAAQNPMECVVFTLQSGEERQQGVRMKDGATYELRYNGPVICLSQSTSQLPMNPLHSMWFSDVLPLRCRHVIALAQGYDELQIPILLEKLDFNAFYSPIPFEPTGQALGRENRILIVGGVSGCVENSIFHGKTQDFVNLYSACGCAETEKRHADALIDEFPAWRHGRADTSGALPFFSGIQHSSKRNWGGNTNAHGSAETFATSSAAGVSYNGAACCNDVPREVTPSTAAGCDVGCSFDA